MITEDYVSFETAKLLNEKGFVAHTEHNMWYVVEDFSSGCHWNSCTYKVGDITREYDKKCCIVMSTLQMAMKWLREVHNLNIGILFGHLRDFKTHWNFYIEGIELGRESMFFHTYEEACEAGIKYCLENLI